MSSSENQESQLEEITVLSSIYGDDWAVLSEDCSTYTIHVADSCSPPRLSLDLQVTLLDSYPSEGPPLFDLRALWLSDEVEETIASQLQSIYDGTPGEVVLFRWIEWLREFLETQASSLASLSADSSDSNTQPTKTDSPPAAAAQCTGDDLSPDVNTFDISDLSISSDPTDQDAARKHRTTSESPAVKPTEPCPKVLHGGTVTDRRSTFQPHCAAVHSIAQVMLVKDELLSNRKIASATHNIMAYRIYDEERHNWMQDCDDDGETAAGSRMLHLMQILDVKDVVVVVTRWYGGIHLGPDRFKHINNCTRSVLVEFGLVPAKESARPGGKSKKAASRNK